MSLIDTLTETAHILFGGGTPQSGCALSVDEAIAWSQSSEPALPICLVKNWVWLDLDATDQEKQIIISKGALPSVLFAHNVIYDSAKRFSPGNWVRSTALVSHRKNFLFETRNTRYVLMGPGLRKTATPLAVSRLS